jgi:hypothetical protein
MSGFNYGMNFGSRDAENNPSYTTLRDRLQVDLSNNAPLYNVRTDPAGSALPVDFSVASILQETIFQVIHGLGYIPQTYTVFTLSNKDGTPLAIGSQYSINRMLLAQGGFGEDYIQSSVNNSIFSVVHYNISYGGGTGGGASLAPLYNISTKYIICNNPVVQTPNFQ